MHTKDKLAAALAKAGLPQMADKAAAGYYDDFLSPLATPCMQLAEDLHAAGTPEAAALRDRAINGEFDATKEESDDWANSPDGADAFAKLAGERKDGTVLGSDKPWRALRPDAQAFDEIRITTVPRYKTSGLSGDEWRISAKIEFMRNGRVMAEDGARDVESAAKFLAWKLAMACDDGKAYFAGEGEFCDQEGCAEKATVTYRLKKTYCREGHPSEPSRPTTRQFCNLHRTRGDCGLEDSDANYEPVE